LTIWVAAHLFFAVAGFQPLFRNPQATDLRHLLLPLLLCTIVYFLLSSWIITIAIALEKHLAPFAIWRDYFAWISLNYFGGASVAALIVSYTNDLNYTFVVLIVPLVPLLALIYATYSRRVGRVQDANQHLLELNSLYVSTIETLAMAIDAKDQVTHGHIRRVQSYAVGLARHLGVTDQALIQAIEAAALLHDMGKLAVPEYILNKPGPLTAAEFERMKLHASIGADILSSINFPYPVVPIVRHHHENWDGSGYPDGLKATHIPLGARILSVVDCYDALTSDRPYRPRLTDEDATRILLERRGTMYDPLVVDTFLKVHQHLSRDAATTRTTSEPELISLAGGSTPRIARLPPPVALQDITASTEEMLALYDLAQGLVGRLDLTDAADMIAKHLRRIVPASTCVFFLYDADKDELVACYASGDNSAHFMELRIPRGQRLTGWVAANKQTIVNSDPVLDLGEAARHLKPRLKSCLSTPLISASQLIGVLSVYSTIAEGFSDDHRRLLEVVARQVSETIKHARYSLTQKAEHSHDGVLGLPHRERVERFVASEIGYSVNQASVSVIVVHVPHLQADSRGVLDRTAYLGEIAKGVTRVLRGGDVLSMYSDEDFVVVLTQTDSLSATAVAGRIHEILLELTVGVSLVERPTLGVASAPDDGRALTDLVATAQSRRRLDTLKLLGRPPAIH
jgi:putative nucleotidyltransferase with HDIG domain